MSIPFPTYTSEQQARIEYLVERVWCRREKSDDVWERDQYGRRLFNLSAERDRNELVALLRDGTVIVGTSMLGEALRALDLHDLWRAAGFPTFHDFTLWFREHQRLRAGARGTATSNQIPT